MISRRKEDESGGHYYVDPTVQLNAGLWTLFAGATVFLAIRVWIKITRGHGLWWDDHILLVTWVSITSLLTSQACFKKTRKGPDRVAVTAVLSLSAGLQRYMRLCQKPPFLYLPSKTKRRYLTRLDPLTDHLSRRSSLQTTA